MTQSDVPASLLARLREDFEAHGREWTRPGLHAVAVHRLGRWRRKIRSKALRAPFSATYEALHVFCRNVYGIELPDSVELGRRVVIEHQGGIVVHGDAHIGDDCILRQGVTLGNRRLETPLDAPHLEAGVNVGAGAVVLGRVRVGEGANIGANAVVLDDVPAGATVVPQKVRVIERHGSGTPTPLRASNER